jgi:hypothetical protein
LKPLLLALLLPTLVLARPINISAPEFPADAAWINSKAFTMKRLKRRRVVLGFFFHLADLHSLRALEAVKVWHKRYELHGLTVIGIHTPEYSFQKDPLAVKRDLRRLGVDFPVVLDNSKQLWEGYGNSGWPASYIMDTRGHIAAERLGEGGYAALESELRAQLREANQRPPEERELKDPSTFDCGGLTPEVSAGARKGRVIDLEGKVQSGTQVLGQARDGEISASGVWDVEPDNIRLAQSNADQSGFARVVYTGTQAFAVLAPAPGGSRFWIKQDELWLNRSNAAPGVAFDEEGRSYVKVPYPGLFELAANPTGQYRQLTVIPDKKGAAVYGFSFANRCAPVKLPPP